MSSWLGHLFFGYLLLGIGYIAQIRYYINLGLPTEIVQILGILAIVGIFCLIPDIDVSSSKIFGFLLKAALIGIIYFAWKSQGWVVMTIAAVLLIISTFKHRGFWHSILAAFIFAIPLLFIGWYWYVISFLAVISHLLLDGEFRLLPQKD